MATRSWNAYLNENKGITASYCHWGGMPDERGPKLLEHYSSVAEAREMVDFGDRSELGDAPQQGVFENVRGQPREPDPPFSLTIEEFLGFTQNPDHSDIEYFYVFGEGWMVTAHGRRSLLLPGEKLPDDSLGESLHVVLESLPVVTLFAKGKKRETKEINSRRSVDSGSDELDYLGLAMILEDARHGNGGHKHYFYRISYLEVTRDSAVMTAETAQTEIDRMR